MQITNIITKFWSGEIFVPPKFRTFRFSKKVLAFNLAQIFEPKIGKLNQKIQFFRWEKFQGEKTQRHPDKKKIVFNFS